MCVVFEYFFLIYFLSQKGVRNLISDQINTIIIKKGSVNSYLEYKGGLSYKVANS